jgi:hypothetical protein
MLNTLAVTLARPDKPFNARPIYGFCVVQSVRV